MSTGPPRVLGADDPLAQSIDAAVGRYSARQQAAIDSAVDQADTREREALTTRFVDALDHEIGRLARAAPLARKTGLPLDLVERNLETVEKETRRAAFDPEDLRRRAPRTAEWFRSDPAGPVVAADLEYLTGLEWLFQAGGRAAARQWHQNRANRLMAQVALGNGLTPDELQELARSREVASQSARPEGDSWLQDAWVSASEQAVTMAQTTLGGAMFGLAGAGAGAGLAAAGGQLGPQVALPEEIATVPAGAASGFAWGSRIGAARETLLMEAGGAFEEYAGLTTPDGQPLDPDLVRAAALATGTVNGALEVIGFGALLKSIPGGRQILRLGVTDAVKQALAKPTVRAALKSAMRSYGEAIATESVTEVGQELTTILFGDAARQIESGDLSLGSLTETATSPETRARLIEILHRTVQATVLLGGAGSASGVAIDLARIEQSRQAEQRFAAMADLAAKLETKEASPDAVESVVLRQSLGSDAGHVFVDGEAWARYWQGQHLDPAQVVEELGLLPGAPLASDIAAAVATGGRIAIPTATWLARLAGTPHHGALAPDLTLDPTGLTPREAEVARAQAPQLVQDLIERANAPDAPADLADEAERVYGDLVRQLEASGQESATARQSAVLIPSLIRTMTDRFNAERVSQGLDPLTQRDLFREFAVEVQAEGNIVRTPSTVSRSAVTGAVPRSDGATTTEIRSSPIHTVETTAFSLADPSREYPLRYRLVPLDQLVTSHDLDGQPRPDYPQQIQPWDRTTSASRTQITELAARMGAAALLEEQRALDRGAPIIGPDLVVESGNGRTLALAAAREAGLATWKDYQARLKRIAKQLGLDLAGVPDAVLVRERAWQLSDDERADFAREANGRASKEPTPVERARLDAARLTPDMLHALPAEGQTSIDALLASQDGAIWAQNYVGALPASERGRFVAADGKLGTHGVTALSWALFYRVFDGQLGDTLLRSFLEQPDQDARIHLKAALFAAVPLWVKVKGAATGGAIGPEFDLAADVVAAARVLQRLKQTKTPVSVYKAQAALLTRELTPLQETLLELLEAHARKGQRLGAILRGYATRALAQPPPSQGALFGDLEPITPASLLAAAVADQDLDDQATLPGVTAAQTRATGGPLDGWIPNPALSETERQAEAQVADWLAAGAWRQDYQALAATHDGQLISPAFVEALLPEDLRFEPAVLRGPLLAASRWLWRQRLLEPAAGAAVVVSTADTLLPDRVTTKTHAVYLGEVTSTEEWSDLARWARGAQRPLTWVYAPTDLALGLAAAAATGENLTAWSERQLAVQEAWLAERRRPKAERAADTLKVWADGAWQSIDWVNPRALTRDEVQRAVTAALAGLRSRPDYARLAAGAALADPIQLAQRAYHGGHEFEGEFSTRAIGSGEGAQVYGHGLYFSSKRGVAEFYRAALAKRLERRGDSGARIGRSTIDVEVVAAALGIDQVIEEFLAPYRALLPAGSADLTPSERMQQHLDALAQDPASALAQAFRPRFGEDIRSLLYLKGDLAVFVDAAGSSRAWRVDALLDALPAGPEKDALETLETARRAEALALELIYIFDRDTLAGIGKGLRDQWRRSGDQPTAADFRFVLHNYRPERADPDSGFRLTANRVELARLRQELIDRLVGMWESGAFPAVDFSAPRSQLYEVDIPEDGEYLALGVDLDQHDPGTFHAVAQLLGLDPDQVTTWNTKTRALADLQEAQREGYAEERAQQVEALYQELGELSAFFANSPDYGAVLLEGLQWESGTQPVRGSNVLRALERVHGPRHAAKRLLEVGIAGTRYPVAPGERDGQNYVVFQDERIKITQRFFQRAPRLDQALGEAHDSLQAQPAASLLAEIDGRTGTTRYRDLFEEFKPVLGSRPLYRRLRTRLRRAGYVDLRGVHVRTSDDVALLMRMYRDSSSESFHALWLRGTEIIAHEAITSGHPDAVMLFSEANTDPIAAWNDRAHRLGATGLWLVHNHPSGNPTPSDADIQVTTRISEGLRRSGVELIGHVILDGDRYGEVYPGGFGQVWPLEGDFRLPDAAEPTLGQVTSPQQVAALAQEFAQGNQLTALWLNTKGEVQLVEHLPKGLLNSADSWLQYRAARRKLDGLARVALFVPDLRAWAGSDFVRIRDLVEQLIAGDALVDLVSDPQRPRSRAAEAHPFAHHPIRRQLLAREPKPHRLWQRAPRLKVSHSLSTAALEHVLEDLDGQLPMPSLAVQQADAAPTFFGEVTLYGSEALALPEKIPVFGGDVFSARWPAIRWKPKPALWTALAAVQQAAAGVVPEEVLERTLNEWETQPQRVGAPGVFDALSSVVGQAWWLREQGVTAFPVRPEDYQFGDQFVRAWRDAFPSAAEPFGGLAAHDRWAQATARSLFEPPKIKIGRETVAYNAWNILEAMQRAPLRAAEGAAATLHRGLAFAYPQFKTLEAMREAAEAGRLRPDAARDPASEATRLGGEFAAAIWKRQTEGHAFSQVDHVFFDYFKRKARGPAAMQRALLENHVAPIDDELIALGVRAAEAYLLEPVPYFEAKPQRLVRLEEFAVALAPAETPARLLDALRARGLIVETYAEGSTSRREAHQRIVETYADELLFQDEGEKLGEVQFEVGTQKFTIRLLEHANLSTFLHETGHVFLAMLQHLAARPDAPESVVRDWEATTQWLGIQDGQITEAQHETWARTWEQWLQTGDAPSEALRGPFAAFRAWLNGIYKGALKLLGGDLHEEIRGVFERLVATDEEITARIREAHYVPFPAEDLGLTPEQATAYGEAIERANRIAQDRIQAEAERERRRASEDWYRERKEALELELTGELLAKPAYRALWFLRRGTLPNDEPVPAGLLDAEGRPLKLSTTEIRGMFEPETARLVLEKLVGATRRVGGVHPDVIAEQFGWDSGDAMLKDFLRTVPRGEAVETAVAKRLQEEFGDFLHDGRLEARATDEIKGDLRVDQMMIELAALTRRAGQKLPTSAEIARAQAAEWVKTRTYGELVPARFQRQEAKARRSAFEAAARGDFRAAVKHQAAALLNLMFYRAAREARERMERDAKHLSGLNSKAAQARLGKAGAAYQSQVNELLERFEFKTRSLAGAQRVQNLAEWVAAERADGRDPIVPPWLIAETQRKHWKLLTYGELSELRDTIDNIEALAALKNGIVTRRQKIERDEALAALIGALQTNMRDPGPGQISKHAGGVTRQFLERAERSHAERLKVLELISRADGRDASGAWHRILWEPIQDAQAETDTFRAEVATRLATLLAELPRAMRLELYSKTIHVPDMGQTFTLGDLLVIGLNWGNESNRYKLVNGGQPDVRAGSWTEAALAQLLDQHLTKAHWDLIQGIWDTFEAFWPAVSALERELTGIAPPKIAPAPFQTRVGQYAGGYFPVLYDRRYSSQGMLQGEANTPMDPLYTRVMTPHGNLIARVDTFAAPISLDIDNIAPKLDAMIHDLTHRRAVLQIWGLLKDPELFNAMRRYFGEAQRDQFISWIRDIANSPVDFHEKANKGMAGWIRRRRSNAAVAAMGFRMTTAFQNFANFANVKEKVSGENLVGALRAFLQDPRGMARLVTTKSPEMKSRINQTERDIGAAFRSLQPGDPFFEAKQFAFWGIGMTDALVAFPGWVAAYRDALERAAADGLTTDEAESRAIAHADSVILETLGSGAQKDLAAVQRGGEFQRLFTSFYSWWNVLYNRQSALFYDVKLSAQEGRLGRDLPGFLARYWWFGVAPVFLSALLVRDTPDDDDDPATWAAWKWATYQGMGFVWLRHVLGVLERGGDPRLTPSLGAVQKAARAAQGAKRALEGDASMAHAAADAVEAGAIYFGVPASQLRATGGTLWDIAAGQYRGDDPAELALDLAYGQRRPQR